MTNLFFVKSALQRKCKIKLFAKIPPHYLSAEQRNKLLDYAEFNIKSRKRFRKIIGFVTTTLVFIAVLAVIFIIRYNKMTSKDYVQALVKYEAKDIDFRFDKKNNPNQLVFSVTNNSSGNIKIEGTINAYVKTDKEEKLVSTLDINNAENYILEPDVQLMLVAECDDFDFISDEYTAYLPISIIKDDGEGETYLSVDYRI